jgi:hypothetical protein
VTDWVRSCKPQPVVVIDSLAAFISGDENSASDMRAFMHGTRRLVDLGATVIVIHHDGKAESARDYRGSSDFKAAVDQAFHVSNISADARLGRLSLRCFKSRYGFTGSLVYDYAGRARTSRAVSLRLRKNTATPALKERMDSSTSSPLYHVVMQLSRAQGAESQAADFTASGFLSTHRAFLKAS